MFLAVTVFIVIIALFFSFKTPDKNKVPIKNAHSSINIKSDEIDDLHVYQHEEGYLIVDGQTYHFLDVRITWEDDYLHVYYKGRNLGKGSPLGRIRYSRLDFNDLNNKISAYKKLHNKNNIVMSKSNIIDNHGVTQSNYVQGVAVTNTYKDKTIDMGNGMFIFKSAAVQESSDLMKQATQLQGEDIQAAVGALRKAQKLLGNGHPILAHLRLPLYLQKAGLYEESVTEFKKLLKKSPQRNSSKFSHQPKETQKYFIALERGVIYDKMRLAAERESRLDDAKKYNGLSEKHSKIAEAHNING